jgi:two-component system, cell cycle sensor histidine kinase and response regulator CckA
MDSAATLAGDCQNVREQRHGFCVSEVRDSDLADAERRAVQTRLLRILIVEDSAQDAESIVRHLVHAGYNPDWVRVDGEAAYREQLPSGLDVIFCGRPLAHFGSEQALQILHESGLPIPLIIVSGVADEESAVNAIREGASDYLLKTRLARLGRAIEHAIEQCRLRYEHRTMMEALVHAEVRYRGLFENAVEGIFQATPEGRLITANPALSRVLGHESPAEAIGMVDDILSQLCPETSQLQELRAGLEKHGLVTGFETQAICRDGRRPWVSLNCRCVRSPTGTLHLEGTVEDITERKKLETQLLRAQRLDSLGRLAGGIAHDLNNILLPILISPGLLRDRLKDELSRDIVDSIEVSARRGADIVRQLLTFSRGSEGERVPVQLPGLVDEMLSIMRETFPKSINLRSTIPAEVWSVRGDETQLHQVLLNLCVNARDAMPGGGDLLLAVENCEVDEAMARANAGARPGRHVLLRVSDTGTGIAPEHLDKIFDPFFTTKAVGQGTGLGLSTVLGIVASHGGFIQLESVVGGGTQFRIYLPACAQLEINGPVPTPDGPVGHGELILLVDDERAVRHATRLMLECHGYRVVEARDGEDALERFQQYGTEVSLAVVDLLMPRMDGVELIRQLRLLPGYCPPIVAMTGVGQSPLVAQLKKLGDMPILEKPFTAEALLQPMAQLLSQENDVAGNWGW